MEATKCPGRQGPSKEQSARSTTLGSFCAVLCDPQPWAVPDRTLRTGVQAKTRGTHVALPVLCPRALGDMGLLFLLHRPCAT